MIVLCREQHARPCCPISVHAAMQDVKQKLRHDFLPTLGAGDWQHKCWRPGCRSNMWHCFVEQTLIVCCLTGPAVCKLHLQADPLRCPCRVLYLAYVSDPQLCQSASAAPAAGVQSGQPAGQYLPLLVRGAAIISTSQRLAQLTTFDCCRARVNDGWVKLVLPGVQHCFINVSCNCQTLQQNTSPDGCRPAIAHCDSTHFHSYR